MKSRRALLAFLTFGGIIFLAASASAQNSSTSVNLSSGGGQAGSSAFVSPNRTQPTAPAQNSGEAGAAGKGSGNNQGIVSSVRRASTGGLSGPDEPFFGLALPQHQLYRGVIPGVRDTLPHVRPHQVSGLSGKRNKLTWVGYQRMNDKSRVFLQTFGVPAFQVLRGEKPGELIIVLQNTNVSMTNFYRNIDARWIPRSVASIRARKVGRDAHIVIRMRRQVEFAVSVDGNYLNIDFNDAFLESEAAGPDGGPVDPDQGNSFRDPDA